MRWWWPRYIRLLDLDSAIAGRAPTDPSPAMLRGKPPAGEKRGSSSCARAQVGVPTETISWGRATGACAGAALDEGGRALATPAGGNGVWSPAQPAGHLPQRDWGGESSSSRLLSRSLQNPSQHPMHLLEPAFTRLLLGFRGATRSGVDKAAALATGNPAPALMLRSAAARRSDGIALANHRRTARDAAAGPRAGVLVPLWACGARWRRCWRWCCTCC